MPQRLSIGMAQTDVVRTLGADQCADVSTCAIPNAGSGGYTVVYFYDDVVEVLEFENQSGYSTIDGVTPDSTLAEAAAIYAVPVNGTVAAAVGRGYAAKEITDYLCSQSGCRASGSHLRHIIFAPGDATRTGHVSTGSIVVTNTSRRWTTVSADIVITGPSGNIVAGQRVSPYLAPGATFTYEPGDFFDLTATATGTYRYTVSSPGTGRGGKKGGSSSSGTFSVNAIDIPLF
ncbi:MAG: hypothetical protein ACK5MT_03420 [Actinomycetales bacterium]